MTRGEKIAQQSIEESFGTSPNFTRRERMLANAVRYLQKQNTTTREKFIAVTMAYAVRDEVMQLFADSGEPKHNFAWMMAEADLGEALDKAKDVLTITEGDTI